LSPDILCLQETEEGTGLNQYLAKALNMQFRFFKKQDKAKEDGVAVFFNSDRFILVSHFEVPFNINLESELYFKPNNVLIVVLQPMEHPDKLYLVANNHLYFNINRGDTKLAQLKMMTDAVALVKNFYRRTTQKKIVVFACGDFNAGPKSGLYEFMRQGEYDCLTYSRNSISGQHTGTYAPSYVPTAFGLLRGLEAKDELPTMRDLERNAEWFTEITNTYVEL